MTRDEIFAQIRDVMVELFELSPSEVTLDAHLIDDLSLDSIDAIDMAVRLQDMTQRRVSEEGLRKVRTVADVVDFVYAHLQAGAAAHDA